MVRFVVTMSVGLLLLGIGASAQSDAKQAPKAKPDTSQQQSSESTSQGKAAAQSVTPSTEDPNNLLNAPITPIPRSVEKQQKPTQPKAQSSDDPDDLLNSPMTPPGSDKPASEQFPFPEDQETGSYSSSKDTQGDLSPPRGDSLHPGADIGNTANDVQETRPWDPHRADKDVEVGTFYLKRGNYKAAESRYRSALKWQDNHAEATYRLGETLQKEGRLLEAEMYYQNYLKILPHGEFAAESKKQIDKINNKEEKKAAEKAPTSPSL